MNAYKFWFVPPPQVRDLSELHQHALQVHDHQGTQDRLQANRILKVCIGKQIYTILDL